VTELAAIELARNAAGIALMLSAPTLIVALVVGLIVSVIQAITQINEMTLSFVPKILGVFAVLAVSGPWLLSSLVTYIVSLYGLMPAMAR